MSLEDPVIIITCAISGALADREQCPAARSDGELVARARRMTEDAGRRPATVVQAREMLGLAS
jgi:uncharacterized protein (DUF849 family)